MMCHYYDYYYDLFVLQLRERLDELVPIKQKELAELKKEYGHRELGQTTVDQVGSSSSSSSSSSSNREEQ